MFGEGISLVELIPLLTAIRQKDLILQVKILDGEWENFSGAVIGNMVKAITLETVTQSKDIRLRLFKK